MKLPGELFKTLLALGLPIAAAISGAYLVVPHEGKANCTYLDPVSIVTSCYGHTGPELKLGQKFTDEQCLNQLATDLASHDTEMMKAVHFPITDDVHAAFLSFCYNVGVNACTNSKAFGFLNAGNITAACSELKRWVYAKGIKLNGLVKRRQSEMNMCMGEMQYVN